MAFHFLFAKNNQLSGTIPSRIFSKERIEQIDLDYNDLSGTLPAITGPRLHVLYLSNNNLSGTIPALGSSLQRIDLSRNNFEGHLHIEEGSLPSLVRFNVEYNQLTGTLPPSLGVSRALLYLGHNYLTVRAMRGCVLRFWLLSTAAGLHSPSIYSRRAPLFGMYVRIVRGCGWGLRH